MWILEPVSLGEGGRSGEWEEGGRDRENQKRMKREIGLSFYETTVYDTVQPSPSTSGDQPPTSIFFVVHLRQGGE